MVQADPRESQLDLAAKNRIAIFHEHGGPDKIQLTEVDTTKQSELKSGEVLVRVSMSSLAMLCILAHKGLRDRFCLQESAIVTYTL